MRKVIFLFVIVVVVGFGYARAPKKILKGEDVSIAEIPHQVSLQYADGFHFCGGSIIDPLLILTAAHCIVNRIPNSIRSDIYVVIGTTDVNLVTPYNLVRVVRRVHHNFTRDQRSNDIAILKVDRPIIFSIFVAPARLPMRDVQADTIVVASGWGDTTYNFTAREGGNRSRLLQKHYGIVITQEKCEKALGKEFAIGPEHICVETPDGADTCGGDSGGPLTHKGEVIGITSFGIGCGLNYPSVFTRVSYYWQWIRVVNWALYSNIQLPSLPEFVEA